MREMKIFCLCFIIALAFVFGSIINQSCQTISASPNALNSKSYLPSNTYTVTRAIDASTFQISTVRDAFVMYTIRIACVASIGAASAGTVSLQYSIDNGSNWLNVGQVDGSNTVSLAIVLNSSIIQTQQLCGIIPKSAIIKMVQGSAGSTTITYIKGFEYY